MNFAHCPTPDNDTEGEEVQDEDTEQADPFLTLSGTEEQYSLSRSINVNSTSPVLCIADYSTVF